MGGNKIVSNISNLPKVPREIIMNSREYCPGLQNKFSDNTKKERCINTVDLCDKLVNFEIYFKKNMA